MIHTQQHWIGCLWIMMATTFGATKSDALAAELRLLQTDATIAIHDGESPILVYNKRSPAVPEGIDPIYRRSGFLHPITSPAGRVVTAAFPEDHPHQHGIFTAWVKTTFGDRDVDFWNLAGRTGRVLHHAVVRTFEENRSVGFEVDLIHRATADPAVDVLRERWKVTVHPTDRTHFCFDLQTTQTALTDQPLIINKYHYGGVAVRGPSDWIVPDGKESASKSSFDRPTSTIVNDQGSDRKKGNHQPTRWVTLSGVHDGQPVSIIMLGHPENFRAPQPARLHPTKPYFCFAPCVFDAFVINRSHPYNARLRCLVTDKTPTLAWLEEQWNLWSQAR